jgi:hypothetical protein
MVSTIRCPPVSMGEAVRVGTFAPSCEHGRGRARGHLCPPVSMGEAVRVGTFALL